jgi:hypothetical protein
MNHLLLLILLIIINTKYYYSITDIIYLYVACK